MLNVVLKQNVKINKHAKAHLGTGTIGLRMSLEGRQISTIFFSKLEIVFLIKLNLILLIF